MVYSDLIVGTTRVGKTKAVAATYIIKTKNTQ